MTRRPQRRARSDSRSGPRPAAALAILLATVLLAGLLAGCSGGDDADTAAAPQTNETSAPASTRSAALDFDATRVFQLASTGVVTVRAIFEPGGELEFPAGGAAEGSGFVLSDEGEIITNAHVVTQEVDGEWQSADEVYVEFADRNVAEAEVVGADPFYDVGLLRIEPGDLELNALEVGSDAETTVGQPVAAIGSPFGAQQSLSVGVISATDRSIRSLTEFLIEGAIQTDASINPGNSGGPLLDSEGRVLGINQQIETRTGRNDGVGYAVPISAVLRSADQLREDGEAAYPYLGVSSQSLYPQLADRLGVDAEFGGMVAEVVPGGPADEAGLRGGAREFQFQAGTYSIGGDVILSIDGEQVMRPDDLARLIGDESPGDTVTLEILRDGDRQTVDVTLGERPLGSLD